MKTTSKKIKNKDDLKKNGGKNEDDLKKTTKKKRKTNQST